MSSPTELEEEKKVASLKYAILCSQIELCTDKYKLIRVIDYYYEVVNPNEEELCNFREINNREPFDIDLLKNTAKVIGAGCINRDVMNFAFNKLDMKYTMKLIEML